MDKLKKIILIIIILLIITLIVTYIVIKKNQDNNNVGLEEHKYEKIDEIQPDESVEAVTSPAKYYSVKNIIDEYYEDISKLSPDYKVEITGIEDESIIKEETENEQKMAKDDLKLMLNKYINIEDVTEEQLNQMFNKYIGESLNIDKMYSSDRGEEFEIYYIQGTLTKSKAINVIIIVVEKNTKQYTLLPYEYIKQKFGTEFNILEAKLDDSIFNINSNKKINYKGISDQQICMNHFGDYIYNIKTDIQKAYNKLDEEYRNKRFGDYNTFEKYVKENYERISNATMAGYQVYIKAGDSTKSYICIDQNNNYYIFNEKAVMDYSLILDIYTVDLPEFEETYNSSNEEDKAKMNFEKIQEAIKNKDYRFIYSKLNETFRDNNFKNLETFENYMNSNFFENNKMSYTNLEKQGEVWLFNSRIKNANSTEEKGINIVIKLNEGTDFEMSFSIK